VIGEVNEVGDGDEVGGGDEELIITEVSSQIHMNAPQWENLTE